MPNRFTPFWNDPIKNTHDYLNKLAALLRASEIEMLSSGFETLPRSKCLSLLSDVAGATPTGFAFAGAAGFATSSRKAHR